MIGNKKLVVYRHFAKFGDGSICELEESLPFTVDDYPFLENWPRRPRINLGTEGESVKIEEKKIDDDDSVLPTFKGENFPSDIYKIQSDHKAKLE